MSRNPENEVLVVRRDLEILRDIVSDVEVFHGQTFVEGSPRYSCVLAGEDPETRTDE